MGSLVKKVLSPVRAVLDAVGLIPDAPDVVMPEAPPSPTDDNGTAEEMARAAEAERKARGRASTILTGSRGLLGSPTTSSRTLLGS
ncbi:hypothetical protein [Rhodospirillaceae bacterium SYSU D60014]|uniref:hypothetical protein n=1 Tax=Virgifigura deserti TaxID=2268457 RepID=UPI000E669EC1